MINIDKIWFSIIRICHKFIDSSISVSNRQHSMLGFHKKNAFLLMKKRHRILPTNILSYLVNTNIFVADIYMDDIANMICQI